MNTLLTIAERKEANYQLLVDAIDGYLVPYGKGLKKEANRYLTRDLLQIKKQLTAEELTEVSERFCREYCDENKFQELFIRCSGRLPFQLNEWIWPYLHDASLHQMMPQMRWMVQIYGFFYYPFNNDEIDMRQLLECAYAHPACDATTVKLYFELILDDLYWSAHHIPDYCLINKADFDDLVAKAKQVSDHHPIDPKMMDDLRYYITLYNCFFDYEAADRQIPFAELCQKEGISFDTPTVVYYDE